MTPGPMQCPRCKQGYVAIYRVKQIGEVIQLCDECEALWVTMREPSATIFDTFSEFMEQRGLPATWGELDETG